LRLQLDSVAVDEFSSIGIQPIYWALSEMARPADVSTRSELAEILLGLAGHLFTTNFTNRWFARMAVQSAFGLKAELAADRPPIMNGYAAAIQGLTNAMLPCTGFEDLTAPNILKLAQFLPSRIHQAFAATDPSTIHDCFLGELNANPSENDRVALEKAREDAMQAAKKLVETALVDSESIFGAYLNGLPGQAELGQTPPWSSFSTPVGTLMEKRPDLFRAAAANEEAINALIKIWQSDASVKNIGRMMEIAWALQSYARKHDRTYPDNLATLFESGDLKPTVALESLLTGKPFIYLAAGQKSPVKLNDLATFILLYDGEPNQHGCYPCAFASGAGSHIRPVDLQEQLSRGAQ
jgi:hypothetical protein